MASYDTLTGTILNDQHEIRSQIFTTGDYSREYTLEGGYTLKEIVVQIRSNQTGTPAFALYKFGHHTLTTRPYQPIPLPGTFPTSADISEGMGVTKVVDLIGDSSTAGAQSFTPASPTTLDRSTPYLIVFTMASGSANLQTTNSNGFDAFSWPSWTINGTSTEWQPTEQHWTGYSDSVQIAVKGTVDATLPLTLDAIATDNVVNIAEKAAGFAITGVTSGEVPPYFAYLTIPKTWNASVTVAVGTAELTTTSAIAEPATWSVSVPANAAYIAGTSVPVSVTVSKSGVGLADHGDAHAGGGLCGALGELHGAVVAQGG